MTAALRRGRPGPGLGALLLFFCGPRVGPLAGLGQEEQSDLERFLAAARGGSRVVRPQAARRLVELGAPAAERLVEESGETPRELAALGADLVEVLGEFEDERLRARLWDAVQDPDFPWRPAAARSLAARPMPAESERLAAFLADHLAVVRVAGLTAVAGLDLRAAEPLVRERLADADDRVRRAAARLVDAWGDAGALAWFVEELRRDDTFFAQRTGENARFAAHRFLLERLGDGFGYDPRNPPSDPANVAALAAVEERCRELAGGELPVLPAVARASGPLADVAFGLELRSCRQGEYFLRWSRDDALHVGTGSAVAVQLQVGTVAALEAESSALLARLAGERVWGEAGCDVEQFHFAPRNSGAPGAPGADERARLLVVTKGPEAVAELRPQALCLWARRLAATLPRDGGDARTRELRRRVRDALSSVGGELGEDGTFFVATRAPLLETKELVPEGVFLSSFSRANDWFWLCVDAGPDDGAAREVSLYLPGCLWRAPALWPQRGLGERGRDTLELRSRHGLELLGDAATRHYCAELTRAEARDVARALGMPLGTRADPEYALRAELAPLEPRSAPGSDAWLELRIANEGPVAVRHYRGGWTFDATRHARFDLAISRAGEPLPDVGETRHVGGFGQWAVLEPGAELVERVNARSWCEFRDPGEYEVRARFQIMIGAPLPAMTSPCACPGLPELSYEDVLEARTTVRIEG